MDKALGHLEGQVNASKRKVTYKVQVELKRDGSVAFASCGCVRGQARCAHMAALLLMSPRQFSPTDVACRWSRRKTAGEDAGAVEVATLYGKKRFQPNYGPFPENIFDELKKNLAECPEGSAAGLKFLLAPEPENVEAPVELSQYRAPDIIELIKSGEFAVADDPAQYLLERLVLSWAEVIEVADKTTGQAHNPEWARILQGRITASKVGQILKAAKSGRGPSASLMQAIRFHKNLDRVKSVLWGRLHEKTAIPAYMEDHEVNVVSTGLWLHESGFFGGSPDGLIGDDAIMEVKCPYTLRSERLQEALDVQNNEKAKDYVVYNVDGSWKINTGHEYYHQTQACMYFTRRVHAILCIWTTKGYIYFDMDRDPSWETNFEIMKKNYFEYFVPYVRAEVA